MQQTLEKKIAEIRQKFVGVIPLRLSEFCEIREQLRSGPDRLSAVDSLRFDSHKIRGVAKTLGFEKLGDLAAISESEAENLLKASPPEPHLGRVAESLENLIYELTTISAEAA